MPLKYRYLPRNNVQAVVVVVVAAAHFATNSTSGTRRLLKISLTECMEAKFRSRYLSVSMLNAEEIPFRSRGVSEHF